MIVSAQYDPAADKTIIVFSAHEPVLQHFPDAAVYGPTPDPQLRLITCGGDFDRSRRSYYDNVVVYAVAD